MNKKIIWLLVLTLFVSAGIAAYFWRQPLLPEPDKSANTAVNPLTANPSASSSAQTQQNKLAPNNNTANNTAPVKNSLLPSPATSSVVVVKEPAELTGTAWGCQKVTQGAAPDPSNPPPTVCGDIPTCPNGESVVVSSGEGIWPDGTRRGVFACSAFLPPSARQP